LKRYVSRFLGAILVVGFLAGSVAGAVLPAIKQRNVLYMAFANESPWSYIDPDGNLAGIDTEMVKECAKRLQLPEVLGVQNAFDGLIPGLVARRYDIVAAGLSWRQKRVDVAGATDPIYAISISPMVPKGNPKNIKTANDIVNSSLKVGAIQGSAEYLLAQDKIKSRAEGYQEQSQLMADLLAGRIDVALNPDAIEIDYMAKNPNAPVEVLPIRWVYGRGVWYVNKDGDDLRLALNQCIKEMKADGTMEKSFTKYRFPATAVLPDGTPPAELQPGF